jgi:hypothetical protein
MPPCHHGTGVARIYNLPRGTSLADGVLAIAEEEGIKTALVSAIGGVDRLTLAYFNCEKRMYEEHVYAEFFEATSILGNITQKDGKAFLHAHGTFGRQDLSVIGGHVVSASVFPLMEVVITPTENTALRRFDDEVGVNAIYRT